MNNGSMAQSESCPEILIIPQEETPEAEDWATIVSSRFNIWFVNIKGNNVSRLLERSLRELYILQFALGPI